MLYRTVLTMESLGGRIIIYTNEISIILGCSRVTAYRHMKNAKRKFNKKRHQYLTIREFSIYSGITVEEIIGALKRR